MQLLTSGLLFEPSCQSSPIFGGTDPVVFCALIRSRFSRHPAAFHSRSAMLCREPIPFLPSSMRGCGRIFTKRIEKAVTVLFMKPLKLHVRFEHRCSFSSRLMMSVPL